MQAVPHWPNARSPWLRVLTASASLRLLGMVARRYGEAMVEGRRYVLRGGGMQTHDFAFEDDTAEGLLATHRTLGQI